MKIRLPLFSHGPAAAVLATVLTILCVPLGTRATEDAGPNAASETAEPLEAAVAAPDRASAAGDDAAPNTGETPAEGSPAAVVAKLDDTLLRVMKEAEALGYDGRYEVLQPVLDTTFDLNFMGAKAAGRHWNELDTDEQQRWLDVFRRFTIANYAGRFNGYTGQSFELLDTQDASHDTVVVATKLINPVEKDVQLNYRMRKTDNGWRIIDVYLQGSVSELALRRAEYGSALDREGVDQVIASIESKIGDLSASVDN